MLQVPDTELDKCHMQSKPNEMVAHEDGGGAMLSALGAHNHVSQSNVSFFCLYIRLKIVIRIHLKDVHSSWSIVWLCVIFFDR